MNEPATEEPPPGAIQSDDVTDYDVICQQGVRGRNIEFRRLARIYAPQYHSKKKGQKKEVCQRMVQEIENNHGRFLEKKGNYYYVKKMTFEEKKKKAQELLRRENREQPQSEQSVPVTPEPPSLPNARTPELLNEGGTLEEGEARVENSRPEHAKRKRSDEINGNDSSETLEMNRRNNKKVLRPMGEEQWGQTFVPVDDNNPEKQASFDDDDDEEPKMSIEVVQQEQWGKTYHPVDDGDDVDVDVDVDDDDVDVDVDNSRSLWGMPFFDFKGKEGRRRFRAVKKEPSSFTGRVVLGFVRIVQSIFACNKRAPEGETNEGAGVVAATAPQNEINT